MAYNEAFAFYFANVDFFKFKENINPKEIYRMLVWMTDGFLHEKQSLAETLDLDQLMNEFYKWAEMFRNMVYKEEWI